MDTVAAFFTNWQIAAAPLCAILSICLFVWAAKKARSTTSHANASNSGSANPSFAETMAAFRHVSFKEAKDSKKTPSPTRLATLTRGKEETAIKKTPPSSATAASGSSVSSKRSPSPARRAKEGTPTTKSTPIRTPSPARTVCQTRSASRSASPSRAVGGKQ